MLDLSMLREVGKSLKVDCVGHVTDGYYLDAYEFKISQGDKVIEYIYVDKYVFEPVKVKSVKDICQDSFAVLKKSGIELVATKGEPYLWGHFDEFTSDDCDEVFKSVEVYNAYVNIISNCLDIVTNR